MTFNLISESKSQDKPDDFIEFIWKTKLYIANTFRRGLIAFPQLWAYNTDGYEFEYSNNKINAEEATMKNRIKDIPVIQSKIKTGKEKFTLDIKCPDGKKSIEIFSDDISPSGYSPQKCLMGYCLAGQHQKINFDLVRGCGDDNQRFMASSIPIFRYIDDEDTMTYETHDTINASYKIISVGAMSPRAQCVDTFKEMIRILGDMRKDFGDVMSGKKNNNITMKQVDDNSYMFIIENYSGIIIRYLKDVIIDNYPDITNVGTVEEHPFTKRYTFRISESSTKPFKILENCFEKSIAIMDDAMNKFSKL